MPDDAPKKKRRRKKRPSSAHDEVEADSSKQKRGAATEADERPGKAGKAEPGGRRRGRLIWTAIVVVGLFELYIFGQNGDIRVCVAREGEHDFALVDQPRNETNTRRYPTCERRFDLGLRGHYAVRVEDAMLHACRRATILRGRDATIDCALERGGWQHRVQAQFVPPWDAKYYQRLFWFLY